MSSFTCFIARECPKFQNKPNQKECKKNIKKQLLIQQNSVIGTPEVFQASVVKKNLPVQLSTILFIPLMDQIIIFFYLYYRQLKVARALILISFLPIS